MGKEGGNEEREVRQPTSGVEGNAENTASTRRAFTVESPKVIGYDIRYIHSSEPQSYENTSEGSSADDARRHRLKKKYYDPNVPLKDFFIGIPFENLKLFKGELVDFSTRKGYKFSYIKNDEARVHAKSCSKGYKWLCCVHGVVERKFML